MVRILNSTKEQVITFNYDTSLPLYVKLGDWNKEQEVLTYWRVGSLKEVILELGVGEDQEVRSIALVALKEARVRKGSFDYSGSVTIGCPVVDLGELDGEDFINLSSQVEIVLDESSACITFSAATVDSIVKNGNVEFLMDADKHWIGVCIKNISQEGMKVLTSSL